MERSIAETKHSVDKILSLLQEHIQGSAGPSIGSYSQSVRHYTEGGPSNFEGRSETPDFPPLTRVQDDLNKSAPIMIVRQYRSSMRRLYKEPGRDVITQRILSEDLAQELISKYENPGFASSVANSRHISFASRLGHIIQIEQHVDLTNELSLRQSSPLLHSVCCLNGLRFCKQPGLVDSRVHRQLYEEVRDMLGQIVLASPLPLEELYALLIMSTFEAAPRVCLHVIS